MATLEAVLQCLQDVSVAAPAAEQRLEQLSKLSNVLPTLAAIAVNAAYDAYPGLRQLAAVVLKQNIKRHWTHDSSSFEPPEASFQDKQLVMQALPAGLSDPESKVRTAIGMCITGIYKIAPESWPGLLESLVAVVKQSDNAVLVQGAIRCLSLMSHDINEQQLPQVAQALLPELHRIAAAGQQQQQQGVAAAAAAALRAQAIRILHDLVKGLEMMSGAQQRQVRDMLVPLVEPWLPGLCAAVAAPLPAGDLSDWSVRMECLLVLTQLVTYFSKPLQQQVAAVMQVCWAMYSSALQLYQEQLVWCSAGQCGALCEVGVDGDTVDLESLIAQLFELLISLAALPRYAKQVKPAMPQLIYTAIAYMQMTAEQEEAWSEDPNQYVADEEDSAFTVRVSGELLLDALMQAFGRDALAALIDAVERRLADAARAQAAGHPHWWKLREASLLALGCCGALGEELAGKGTGRRGAPLRERLQRVVDGVLAADLQAPGANPLLAGRALWVAARLAPLLREDQRPALLAAAAEGLSHELPGPVKIGACRALACLAASVSPAHLAPLADRALGGMVRLLQASGEDTANLVLEGLVPLVKADPSAAARNLGALSGPVLEVWGRCVNDPLVSVAAQDVLAALAAVPHCLGPLAQQALPVLAAVIQQQPAAAAAAGHAQPGLHASGGLLEGCMELVAVLVRPRLREVVQAAVASCMGPLMALVAASDDASAVQGATELLCELVRAAGPEILAWGLAPGGAALPPPHGDAAAAAAHADTVFRSLLGTLERLLDPSLDEHRSLFAGHLAHQMLTSLPAQTEAVAGQLLGALCVKLVASNMSVLVGGLIAALSLLACRGGGGPLLDALGAMSLTPHGGGAPVNGVAAVVPLMAERQSDVQGRFRVKQAAMALASMLASGHPLLLTTLVRGKRIDTPAGVRTRRQVAAGGGERWSEVPLAAKLAAVVSELMVEQPWQADGLEADEAELLEGLMSGDYGAYVDGDDDDDDGGEGEEEEEVAMEGEAHSPTHGPSTAAELVGPMGLSITGIRISSHAQSALDASIAASPTLHAESAAAGQDDDAEHAGDPLAGVALQPHLARVLLALQAGAAADPAQRALLAAAAELLSPKMLKQASEVMAAVQQEQQQAAAAAAAAAPQQH